MSMVHHSLKQLETEKNKSPSKLLLDLRGQEKYSIDPKDATTTA